MAGKVGSASFGVLLVDGYDFLASKLKAFTHKVTALQERSDGLGDATETMTPTGLLKLEVTQAGAFFDDTTNQTHTILATLANLAVSRLLCAAFAGNTIGKPFLGASGLYAHTYDVLGQVGQLTKANVTYTVSGSLDRGVILNSSVAKTVDWNTKTDGNSVDYTTDTSQRNIPITSNTQASPTVITTPVPHGLATNDIILIAGNTGSNATLNGERTVTVISTTTFSVPVNCGVAGGTGGSFVRSNTAFGAYGYQMVSAFSGFTGFVGKVRDSPDDVTYADLITFTNVTSAPNAQRITNGVEVVDRYLSFTGDVTGAGSITVFVGLSRLLA
jgi:hypothetical protein